MRQLNWGDAVTTFISSVAGLQRVDKRLRPALFAMYRSHGQANGAMLTALSNFKNGDAGCTEAQTSSNSGYSVRTTGEII